MSSNTLDALGRAILETLDEGPTSIDTMEATFDTAPETLESHLQQLIDNALVREAPDGRYELTDNGRRLLRATPTGEYVDRTDIPPPVERAIASFSLPPDEEQAVRTAFSFLAYWGDATTAELVDGCYSESPAGYETPEEWWAHCIEDRLEGVPLVDAPELDLGDADSSPSSSSDSSPSSSSDSSTPSTDSSPSSPRSITTSDSSAVTPVVWTYERTPVVDRFAGGDGRNIPDSGPPYGSVRHGLESRTGSEDERAAARVAFAILFEAGTVSEADLVERAYDNYPAGYDSSTAWLTWLSDLFESLPGIERGAEAADEPGWQYSPTFDRT
ncbi:hypothetical protein [Halostagnicola kamekurae]|uniref:Uncharacterized protein n=1 Tax=Halostagnicola kamekurae TaxID=619731 RepID=A0A1I6U6L1_9EURY|nr:hypothetical protein [Halostagnicola kamekurae]SFS96988.1 hypothetical protein SAMN04488556_3589 [Halostagnicola kamekurae]